MLEKHLGEFRPLIEHLGFENNNCKRSRVRKIPAEILYGGLALFLRQVFDGFDPKTPQVPLKERPDLDRWILSDLQKLIRTAREAFENFDVSRDTPP